MKKQLIFACAVLMLAACKQEKAPVEDLAAIQQRDSLERIIAQKDNEINDMMSTFNDIEEGFRQINEAENRVSLAQKGEGSSSRERIRENIQFIQSTMQRNRELVNKLKQQLRESSVSSEQLRRTIENMVAQLDEKEQQLQKLRAELDAKDIRIAALDEKIADLNENVTTLSTDNSEKQQTINTQDKQLNTAWFVFGTKDELKEQRILKDGRVLQSDYNKDYFTKIDIRVDKEIKLYSRSAKLLTAHPAASYTLQRDANKQYVLRIVDPQSFWSTSKYLVVLVK